MPAKVQLFYDIYKLPKKNACKLIVQGPAEIRTSKLLNF